ncbi:MULTISPECIES: Crp/Fnr family transcriptional regulator [Flavobacteriales]|uniref:CRP/FNR family transcriptional regulator, anaerobic regulatory protein n=1 Tax=Aequorivita viscosa TaxID=797419 RepID=A0A1M6J2W6_9FLAO|nr:Crp/Fnr family transcriptional regulator [Aequorivita viscosa]SDX07783.1 CRP/FNR family transcriptional regulator, anaerobic regulatory protein [Aequorivita viscosa]SHJ41064.1 CRP/FNR family transcriptional regulator, anaerobic regulatory protein [Aequorivita viscosa]
MLSNLKQNFSHLFEDDLIAEINQVGNLIHVTEGDKLIEIGDYLRSMPLLISGAIKILREDSEGDELLLYFLEPGDTCAMTLTCCLGQKKSEIRALAELDTTLVMIPVQKMEEWMGRFKSWRNFVLASYHTRLMEMLDTIDSIAFLNMDERLVKYLRDKKNIAKTDVIASTHQEIAYELHTSRVVVSRLLKKLESMGKIALNRNSIKIIEL